MNNQSNVHKTIIKIIQLTKKRIKLILGFKKSKMNLQNKKLKRINN
jgi:hypothetical protein